ncbi:class II fructose-bisphosphate aldolase [Vibrio vulnificus]|uniref:class II fructose-bisphosphate aldolase n=1 Tax=Vibrio vulnificus TaxID=672 RepID=UPI001029103D|nr:class II fructose-bisphosphate aldolase [Vibrio vulnificus]RZP73071.1 class II fructose-bisphosphate aldolase [Vibrio vulnificus]RZP74390.1 class II fructose-bisphosphate aldolase [Vibrio vulnificus]
MQKLSELLQEYYKEGKCLVGFNFNDIWDGQAVCAVAEKNNEPVMLMAYTAVVDALGLDLVVSMVDGLRKRYDVPIYLHLDHCPDVEMVLQAVDAGFDSVMYDGSALSLEENIANTRKVVDYAHTRGVVVEAELGKIRGRGYTEGDDYLAAVDDVRALYEQTGVNMIAVGIGTAHGHYQGEPEIRFDRLEEIYRAVDVPLVLHGGTGISAEDIRKSVTLGIAKINVGTAIHTAYMQNLGKEIQADGMNAYPPVTMQKVLPLIEKEVQSYTEMVR